MAVPVINPEDRAAALAKAQKVRKERSVVREQIKAGKIGIKDIVAKKDDPIYGGMRVKYVLESYPGIGKIRANEIMEQAKIHETRKIKGLGCKQIEALEERLK